MTEPTLSTWSPPRVDAHDAVNARKTSKNYSKSAKGFRPRLAVGSACKLAEVVKRSTTAQGLSASTTSDSTVSKTFHRCLCALRGVDRNMNWRVDKQFVL